MTITNNAVDMAAQKSWDQRNDGTRPSWSDAIEDSRWVDAVEEIREETRKVLEAAAPQFEFDVLMAAADDLAGDPYSSHWAKIGREFQMNDGEKLTPQHSSYLEALEEAREFLYRRAHETRGTTKYRS